MSNVRAREKAEANQLRLAEEGRQQAEVKAKQATERRLKEQEEANEKQRAAEHVAGLQPDIRTLAQTKKQRFVYLGSGPLEGLAHESALKMLELTAGEVVTYFDSPLGFRHGPKSALDGDTLAVVYVSTDPYTRRYDLDIVAEIRAQLGRGRRHRDQRRADPRDARARRGAARAGRSGRRPGRPAVSGVRPVPGAVHRAGARQDARQPVPVR